MLNNQELIVVVGGASISGTMINAIVRAVNIALEIGRALGSSIRRGIAGKGCAI